MDNCAKLFMDANVQATVVVCPDKVAPRIIKEMNDPKWPDEFRLGLAGALQTMYQEAEQPKAVWEVELQHFYPAALGYAEPGTVRLLATLIEQGLAEPSENGTKRKFIAKQETWDAMRGCIWRLRLVKDDPYQEAPATIHELQDLLEAYKPHQSATTSPSSASN